MAAVQPCAFLPSLAVQPETDLGQMGMIINPAVADTNTAYGYALARGGSDEASSSARCKAIRADGHGGYGRCRALRQSIKPNHWALKRCLLSTAAMLNTGQHAKIWYQRAEIAMPGGIVLDRSGGSMKFGARWNCDDGTAMINSHGHSGLL